MLRISTIFCLESHVQNTHTHTHVHKHFSGGNIILLCIFNERKLAFRFNNKVMTSPKQLIDSSGFDAYVFFFLIFRRIVIKQFFFIFNFMLIFFLRNFIQVKQKRKREKKMPPKTVLSRKMNEIADLLAKTDRWHVMQTLNVKIIFYYIFVCLSVVFWFSNETIQLLNQVTNKLAFEHKIVRFCLFVSCASFFLCIHVRVFVYVCVSLS